MLTEHIEALDSFPFSFPLTIYNSIYIVAIYIHCLKSHPLRHSILYL